MMKETTDHHPFYLPAFCHDCLIFFPEKNHFPKLVEGAPILLRSSTSLQKRERTICLSLLAHWLIPGFHIFSSDRGEMQFSTGSSVEVHNFIVIRNLSVKFPLMQTVLIIKQTFDSSLWVPVISATNDYSPICSWVCLKANDEYWFTLLRHEIFFLLPLPSLDDSFANVVTVCFLKYWNYTAEEMTPPIRHDLIY